MITGDIWHGTRLPAQPTRKMYFDSLKNLESNLGSLSSKIKEVILVVIGEKELSALSEYGYLECLEGLNSIRLLPKPDSMILIDAIARYKVTGRKYDELKPGEIYRTQGALTFVKPLVTSDQDPFASMSSGGVIPKGKKKPSKKKKLSAARKEKEETEKKKLEDWNK